MTGGKRGQIMTKKEKAKKDTNKPLFICSEDMAKIYSEEETKKVKKYIENRLNR